MVILGVTGGIGSGKTTVTNIFALLNIPIYIADTESKRITATSPVVKEKLIQLFGKSIYQDGVLNKKMLASYIFTDKDKLEQVNNIIHPEVEKDFKSWIKANKDKKVLIIETAILFEAGFQRLVDKTAIVYTPLDERITRAIKRDGSSREEIEKRINSQMSDEEKKKLSDFIITNDNKHSLIKQVLFLLNNLENY